MPNPNTITTIRHQDIQIDDVNLRTQFENMVQVGQYQQALDLLTTNAQQLQGKAYIANLINTIITGILTLENYYNTGVTIYLSNLAVQFQTMINNFLNRGLWNDTTEYVERNFVVYNDDVYMALQDVPVGTLPTNTTYWLFLGLQGLDGAPGTDVVMRYNWNSSTIYQPNDLVVYNDAIWVNLVSSSGPNTDPINNPSSWLLFMQPEAKGIHVGINPPDDPINNSVWFQTTIDPLAQPTGTNIVGVFNRYIQSSAQWEPMYPRTVFQLVNDRGDYIPLMYYEERTITVAEWVNNQYTFSNPYIGADSVVNIFPVIPISSQAYRTYNLMKISISGTTVTLSVTEAPTVDLSIRVKIQ